MSLQVWLPLTKDTRNQGIMNLPSPWEVWTRDNSGKLGQYCYSDCAIYHITEEWLNNEWSLACWVKSSSWSQYNDILLCKNTSESTSSQFYFSIINGTTLNLGINGGSGGVSYNYTFATNTWYHVAATYNGNIACLYINGNQVKSQSYTTTKLNGMNNFGIGCRSLNAAGTAATGNTGAKRLNDVRVYNHALSQMEVKQLSQGLILHYPLNRQGFGQENLIRNTQGVFVSGLGSTDGSRAEFRSRTLGCSLPIETEKTYTLSFDLKMILNTPSNSPYFLVYNSNYKGPHGKWIWQPCDSMLTGNYSAGDIIEKKIIIHFTTPTSFEAGSYTDDNIEFYSTYGTSNWFEVSNLKLEEGSIATPWCPNSSDALATTMGLNSITEYDCSGFCNNGTRTGTFDWTSNTAKYAVSTKFNGTDNAIQTPSLPTMITDKNYTIAVWIYKTVIGSKGYQTIYGGPSGFEIEARNGGANETKFVPWNWGKPMASYELNEWNHCVFVHSDVDCKIYLNGEYIATGTAKASNPTGNYFVGAWNTATQQNFEGLMSDFRIYATALSADDVKSLYQNCATIDPDGTIRGQIRS